MQNNNNKNLAEQLLELQGVDAPYICRTYARTNTACMHFARFGHRLSIYIYIEIYAYIIMFRYECMHIAHACVGLYCMLYAVMHQFYRTSSLLYKCEVYILYYLDYYFIHLEQLFIELFEILLSTLNQNLQNNVLSKKLRKKLGKLVEKKQRKKLRKLVETTFEENVKSFSKHLIFIIFYSIAHDMNVHFYVLLSSSL